MTNCGSVYDIYISSVVQNVWKAVEQVLVGEMLMKYFSLLSSSHTFLDVAISALSYASFLEWLPSVRSEYQYLTVSDYAQSFLSRTC